MDNTREIDTQLAFQDDDHDYNDVEIKSEIEISKIEYIYEHDLVNRAEHLESNTKMHNKAMQQHELPSEQSLLLIEPNTEAVEDEEKNFKCKFCSMAFTTNFQLEVHVNIHNLERPYLCTICNRSFQLSLQLARHCNKEHKEYEKNVLETRYKCEYCTKSFIHPDELKVHVKHHNETCPFKCEVCSKPFAYHAEYIRHMKKHSNKRNFCCSTCGRHYKHEKSLKIHEKEHTTDKIKKYTKTLANKEPKISTSFKEVKDLESNNSKDVHCPSPSDASNKEANLSITLPIDLEEEDEIFQISDDSNEYDQDSDMESQLNNAKEVTTTEFRITAQNFARPNRDEAKYNEKIKTLLKAAKKKFVCQYCSKEFAKGYNLKVHLRVHTGEQPYICSVCNKAYKQNRHLKIHLQTHSGENNVAIEAAAMLPKENVTKKPIYKCEICSRICPNKSEFKRHRTVHTGERPFACSLCEQTYKHEDHLKNHQKVHPSLNLKR